MGRYLPLLDRFRRDEAGATAIEYALIAGLIAMAIVSGLQTIGPALNGGLSQVESGFSPVATR
jgi:pilus assembly protein Flp/PilA